MTFRKGRPASAKDVPESSPRGFLGKLKKRHILETIAAFIGGGWLLIEIVERLFVGHYGFPEQLIDLTVISVIGALLATLVRRWFRGRPGKIRVDVLVAPLIILATLAADATVYLHVVGIAIKAVRVVMWALCLGILWVIFKLLQWTSSAPEPEKGEVRVSASAAGQPEKSIAVLPFKDMSPQKDQDYFCEGLAEELINALAQVKDLRVAARTSSSYFRGKDADIREIGEALNVGTVLEGSVQKVGDRLRITAQLISVVDGYHLWSQRFDRSLKDIFAVQDEISLAIVDRLKVELLAGEKEKMTKRHTQNQSAHNMFIKGRYFWNRRYQGDMIKAVSWYEKALRRDPNYALPYVGIADVFNVFGMWAYIHPQDASVKTRKALWRALRIDGELSEAYSSLGLLDFTHDRDFAAADEHLKRSIELNPANAYAHGWNGIFLTIVGVIRRRSRRPAGPWSSTRCSPC